VPSLFGGKDVAGVTPLLLLLLLLLLVLECVCDTVILDVPEAAVRVALNNGVRRRPTDGDVGALPGPFVLDDGGAFNDPPLLLRL
jgi:hypothetical protein